MEGLGFNTVVVLLGATALGIAAGTVGTFLLLRRRALISDALAHATLPGLALGFLVGLALGVEGRSLPLLLLGALATGGLAVIAVQILARRTRLPEDAAIGAVLSATFGLGIVLLSVVQALPAAGAAGLKHFIFGQTAAMSAGEAMALGVLATSAALLVALFFKELRLVAFDAAFAGVQGWSVARIDLILMGLVAVVTVVGLQTVGLVMIVALLITPAAAARFWTERLERMVLISAAIGGASGLAGALLSSLHPGLPAGAVIVLVATSLFLASLTFGTARGLIAVALERAGLRRSLRAEAAP